MWSWLTSPKTKVSAPSPLFSGLRRLLDQQFERLSPLEKSVMYWLAINREGTTVDELQDDIIPNVSRLKLLWAIEGLWGRSLIERQSGCYTQQPVVMEYVTNRLIEEISIELTQKINSSTISITTNSFELLFQQYALVKTTVKDYIRDSQVRLILQPIVNKFRQVFNSPAALKQQILQVLTALRDSETRFSNYGGGNLFNICCELQLDLTGYDFSHLTLYHAYFQGKTLHQVNLAHANLHKSIFTQTFGGILSVAFSPDGNVLATGDSSNDICLWSLATGQPIQVLKGHSDWVRTVRFSADGRLLYSSSDDQTIRVWDIDDLVTHLKSNPKSLPEAELGHCITVLAENPSRASSIALSADGLRLASSSEDHTVWLWDIETGRSHSLLRGHTNPVWCVAFSPTEPLLASSGEDDYVQL